MSDHDLSRWEIELRLSRDRAARKYPAEVGESAMAEALDAANEAARMVLESIALPSVLRMSPETWKRWRDILGGYDTSNPTGTRIGKRWCRQLPHGQEVCEYVEHPDRRFVGITTYKVILT